MYQNIKTYLILIVVVVSVISCDDEFPDGRNNRDGNINTLPETPTYPSDNPYSAEKENLGRMLFWDPILSGNKDVACVSCHHPDFGYADGIELSLGVNGVGLGINRVNGDLVQRNSPTIINTVFNGINNNGDYSHEDAPMFWDIRVTSLEEQAHQPMLSKEEMRGEGISEEAIMDTIVQRLNAIPAYQTLFTSAFGTNEINLERILQAIATFERGIVATNSRFDQFMRGDNNALSNEEIRGMNLLVTVGCTECHGGPMFSDYELHTIGVPDHASVIDEGANGDFDFRTPSLRNLSFTAPYMHNGRFESLEEVLDFYEDVSDGRQNAINDHLNFRDLDRDVRNLNLGGRDIDEIVAFLKTLNDSDFDKTVPSSVPSNLPVGGNIQ